MWNVGTILTIAMRVIANAGDIIALIRKLWPALGEAQALAAKIAPELMAAAAGRELPTTPAVTYDVRWLQASLNGLVDAGLEVDGDYGPLTKAAVEKFQRANPPLEVDGWAGVQTEAMILQALARK